MKNRNTVVSNNRLKYSNELNDLLLSSLNADAIGFKPIGSLTISEFSQTVVFELMKKETSVVVNVSCIDFKFPGFEVSKLDYIVDKDLKYHLYFNNELLTDPAYESRMRLL